MQKQIEKHNITSCLYAQHNAASFLARLPDRYFHLIYAKFSLIIIIIAGNFHRAPVTTPWRAAFVHIHSLVCAYRAHSPSPSALTTVVDKTRSNFCAHTVSTRIAGPHYHHIPVYIRSYNIHELNPAPEPATRIRLNISSFPKTKKNVFQ